MISPRKGISNKVIYTLSLWCNYYVWYMYSFHVSLSRLTAQLDRNSMAETDLKLEIDSIREQLLHTRLTVDTLTRFISRILLILKI